MTLHFFDIKTHAPLVRPTAQLIQRILQQSKNLMRFFAPTSYHLLIVPGR
jgi:hypothetical protein